MIAISVDSGNDFAKKDLFPNCTVGKAGLQEGCDQDDCNTSNEPTEQQQKQYSISRKQRQKAKRKARRAQERELTRRESQLDTHLMVTGGRLQLAYSVPQKTKKFFSRFIATPKWASSFQLLKAAYADVTELLQEMQSAVMTSSSDCVLIDIAELQVKCHEPKQGNPNISFEFYGSDVKNGFGYDYTFEDARKILVGFMGSDIGNGAIYRKQFERICQLGANGCAVMEEAA